MNCLDKIFENRAANGGECTIQLLTSHGRTEQQSNVIDRQLSTPLTFSQCGGISDIYSESEDSSRERQAKIPLSHLLAQTFQKR